MLEQYLLVLLLAEWIRQGISADTKHEVNIMKAWFKRYRYTFIALIFVLLLPFFVVLAKGIFTMATLDLERPTNAAAVFDRNGEVIGYLGNNSRYVSLDNMPEHLQQAVIAVEDSRFYQHPGFDVIGLARAVYANLQAGETAQGGSTITQQLAKNLFLHPGKTFARKFEELALAILLEIRYSKDQILEFYLNTSYFGESATGVENAARSFFGKTAADLTLGESALIAGLLQAPSAYNPYRNLDRALDRRSHVLDRMVDVDYIKLDLATTTKAEHVDLTWRTGGTARYFLDWIASLMTREFGETTVYSRGLRIHTTLDLQMQKIADQLFASQDNQGALVAIDPRTGGILSLVGGRNYIESQFNRAINANRQPGSVFKPIIYAAAIKNGWHLNTIVDDIPREYSGYKPQNHGEAYWGPVTMKHAVTMSLNNAAVWTLNEIGLTPVFTLAQDLNLGLVAADRNLAMALGGLTAGVSPLEMTAAYVPFANGGTYFTATPILRVLDSDGNVLLDNQPEEKRVFTPQQAYLMTDILQAVMEYGTGSQVPIDRPSAGKTGTTNEQNDLWFVGYTPDIVVGIYMGNDDNSPVAGYGGSTAGPVWAEYINRSLADTPAREFPVPQNITTDVQIDVFTGLLADEHTEWVELDAFVVGTEPTRQAHPTPTQIWDLFTNPEPVPQTEIDQKSEEDESESEEDEFEPEEEDDDDHESNLEEELKIEPEVPLQPIPQPDPELETEPDEPLQPLYPEPPRGPQMQQPPNQNGFGGVYR